MVLAEQMHQDRVVLPLLGLDVVILLDHNLEEAQTHLGPLEMVMEFRQMQPVVQVGPVVEFLWGIRLVLVETEVHLALCRHLPFSAALRTAPVGQMAQRTRLLFLDRPAVVAPLPY